VSDPRLEIGKSHLSSRLKGLNDLLEVNRVGDPKAMKFWAMSSSSPRVTSTTSA